MPLRLNGRDHISAPIFLGIMSAWSGNNKILRGWQTKWLFTDCSTSP